MSILIEGMEMPTTCGNCWFCHAVSNEKWHCRLTGKSFASYSVGWGDEKNTGENGQHPYIRRDDCPFIEVPEPHGRLGDLDELAKQIEHDRYHHTHTDGLAVRHHIAEYGHFLNAISKAPTIIPESEEVKT